MGPTTVKTENSQPGLSLGPSSRALLLRTRVAAARLRRSLRSRDGGALAGSVFFSAKLPGGLGGEEPGTMRAATEARACPSGPLGLQVALSGKSWAPTPGAVARGRPGGQWAELPIQRGPLPAHWHSGFAPCAPSEQQHPASSRGAYISTRKWKWPCFNRPGRF